MNFKPLLVIIFIIAVNKTFAQTNKAYAITGQASANFNWVDIREIDLATGTATKLIYESGRTPFSYLDYYKKTPVYNKEQSAQAKQSLTEDQTPTQSLVAAAAFDERHNKLFYMPLKSGELSWIDLKEKAGKIKFYYTEPALKTINFGEEANNITRMTIGADGNGYAITNDCNHLIRFTTGNNVIVNDLGSINDAAGNEISIHHKINSWGGDIIADAYGKLYLFSAGQHVFVIDLQDRVATYKGKVKDIPSAFSINGAAVDKNDNIIVSTANSFTGYYKFNIDDLKATKLLTKGQIFNASDLANGNLLYQNKYNEELRATPKNIDLATAPKISVFPNPVIGSTCNLLFNKISAGTYNLSLSDASGRTVINKNIYVKAASQIENLRLADKMASGIYFIKISDIKNKSVFSDKIVFK